MQRREFLHALAMAGAALGADGCSPAKLRHERDIYNSSPFGQARILHFTDCHAQLLPVYFREPSVNLGFGEAFGRPPHLVGDALLQYAGIKPGTRYAYAFSHLDFVEAARRFGTLGGFSYLSALINRMRSEYGDTNTLLLDGGDTWQGSATANWTQGRDMVGACNLLGVDVMTGHWSLPIRLRRWWKTSLHLTGNLWHKTFC